MTMSYQLKKFSDVENVGLIDSVFRSSLSIAIVVSELLIPSISSVSLVLLTFVAIYAGLTGFLSWDPVYALIKKGSQRPLPEKLSATRGSENATQRVEPAASEVSRKKAA
jgi:hypothetical protein